MAGLAFRNYLGSNTNLPIIDSDTLCRQLSTAPGGVGLCGPSEDRIAFGQRFLVGKARRGPGFNFDGTRAEDMQSGDQPPSAVGLAKERIFAETDSALEERLRDLVRSLSTGPMEAVALRMVDHFVGASGTAFEDATLNDEVRKNPAFAEYWADIEKHGGDRLPFPGTGNGFKAWYILQHYRQAKPFVTEIRVSLPVSSG